MEEIRTYVATCNSELDAEKMQSIIDEYTNIINENNKEYTFYLKS